MLGSVKQQLETYAAEKGNGTIRYKVPRARVALSNWNSRYTELAETARQAMNFETESGRLSA
jgi:hypothetical protein